MSTCSKLRRDDRRRILHRLRAGCCAGASTGRRVGVTGFGARGAGADYQPPTSGGRGSRRTSGRSARGRLGAGLVEIPPVPYRDPASAVLADPQVPENRRFCGSCEQPVGRGRDGRAGMTDGFCRNCGTRFSFTPKLAVGDLVAGQYEVLGCLAFGGLGWIYLARDRNVSDRWVVLKGLLNTGDADAMAAAVAERQFLAEVEHPNIVRIYNFVQHADHRTGESAGYIVMEYVGRQVAQGDPPGRAAKWRVGAGEHAIAYAIEVLPALGYLHDRGLVYCDFKPDNVIQTEEQLKLIDMGGVRRIDGDEPIYGTVGYQAPEIETDGPSVSSDLFTVARALAVLTFEFQGYQGTYKFTLPDGVPLLAQQESFARLLRRATERRSRSALRLGGRDGRAAHRRAARGSRRRGRHAADPLSRRCSALSSRRSGQRRTPQVPHWPRRRRRRSSVGCRCRRSTGPIPRPVTWPRSPGSIPASEPPRCPGPSRATRHVPSEVATSAETRLALARARLDVGDYDGAAVTLADLAADDPSDWRVAWTDGLRVSLSAIRRRSGRSARSTTSCRASSRPSWRWLSPPRLRAISRRQAATSGSSGRWTGPTSARRSDWREPAWRLATGPARSRRWPPCRRRRVITQRRRSQRSASWCQLG